MTASDGPLHPLRPGARPPSPAPRRRAATAAVGLLVLVAGLVVAGGAPSPAGANGLPEGVEWFTGTVDEFYVVPERLPRGAAGELIRVQPVTETATTTTLRIMYHSRDAQRRDRAVTGTLTYPKATPPPGGWPVVSNANGTSGMNTRCALSRRMGSSSTWGLPAVAVTTDYIGLGPVGERHPYLSRTSEANSVIDAVRAARQLPAAGAGTRWMAIGGSQGGHAALSANELGQRRAPELQLLGTVALAPGAMFDRDYGGIDTFVKRVVTAMGLYGAATEYPDIDPDDYVTPAVRAVAGVVDTGCLPEVTTAFLGVPFDGFWTNDPIETEPARSVFLANDVGHARVDAPTLVVQGTEDTTVVPARTDDLVERMCGVGQVVSHLVVPGADHQNVGTRSVTEIRAWMEARLRGESAPTSCPVPVAVPGTASVVEGDDGLVSLAIPVTLSRPSSSTVTVGWLTGVVPGLAGQATPPGDYRPVHGTVTFAPGQTVRHAVVRVRGDVVAEADELVVVAFGGATGASVGGAWGLGFGTIVDDD